MAVGKAQAVDLDGLFVRGLGGDRAAYREFLSEISALLRIFIRRHLRSWPRGEDCVEDVLQEALLAIHARRHTHDRDVPVSAWAYGIARYKLIDFLRTTRRSAAEIPLDAAPDVVGDDAASIDAALTARKVVTMIPERFRMPIELMKVQGLSTAEAAKATGMSEASVKVNVHRGMKMLARLLRGER